MKTKSFHLLFSILFFCTFFVTGCNSEGSSSSDADTSMNMQTTEPPTGDSMSMSDTSMMRDESMMSNTAMDSADTRPVKSPPKK